MASADLSFSATVRYKQSSAEESEAEDEGAAPLPGQEEDICRVCRAGSLPGRPLFHPCLCTGSIKHVHQDCLVQWLQHSSKEHCELCKHRFQFTPVYRRDMPPRLPLTELVGGAVLSLLRHVRRWLHLALVALMWLAVVPISVYRIYRFLLYGSLWGIATFPLQLFSLEGVMIDEVYGLLMVAVSLVSFISLAWLKNQLGNGGAGPGWLDTDQREVARLEQEASKSQATAMWRHLESAGKRSRQRQRDPKRVAASNQVNENHEILSEHMSRIELSERDHYHSMIEQFRVREMQLLYDLGEGHEKYHAILTEARETRYAILGRWREHKRSEWLEQHRALPGNEDSYPEGWPHIKLKLPYDVELGLAPDSLAILQMHGRTPTALSSERREKVERELAVIRTKRSALLADFQQHTQQVCMKLSMPADTKPDEEEWGEGFDEAEIQCIREARAFKSELATSTQEERAVIHQQNEVDQQRRQEVEERMNRWYNRLLNRHQDDDPMVLARRQRRHRGVRPNIGQALARLAREQPEGGGAEPANPAPAADNAEELSWNKLLGLDGSYRFIEHVLWLILIDAILIIGFVYIPYQLGWAFAMVTSLWEWVNIVTWRGVVTTLIGYTIATFIILAVYYGTGMLHLAWLKTLLGKLYIVIKVGLILAVEAGLFPLMCGWWMDICSFAVFGSTLTHRQASLQSAPGTVMFLHWLAGMIFIFYLASLVLLLREVLRPGVLWFLRNLNDQNFHPINEMIALPFQRHIKRLVMSCLMFGVCVMVVLLVPSKLIVLLFPRFLPYNLSLSSALSPMREVQLELVLLQFVIPTLLEHSNCRAAFKLLIQNWAAVAARLFGLQSYLLDKHQTGGVIVDLYGARRPHEQPAAEEVPVYAGPVQVLGPGFPPFKPYLRPPYFHLRVTLFILYTAAAISLLSVLAMTVPVAAGRGAMALLGISQPPEVYTVAIGLYLVWLCVRLLSRLTRFVTSQGGRLLIPQLASWLLQAVKCALAGALLLVVIPLLLGHLVDLFVITPLRVPADRTPIFYPSTEWALGLLHTKCVCGAVWLTNTQFKRTLEQVYHAGLQELNLSFIVAQVAWPVILWLSLIITVPYVFFMGLLPSLGLLSFEHCLLLYRYSFPGVLCLLLSLSITGVILKQCQRLYNHVRNEKYLVGRQLVNVAAESMEAEVITLTTPVQETGLQ